MRKTRQVNRNRVLRIEALENRTPLAGDLAGQADLIGVAWDFQDSPVYAFDATTGAATLIGNSGLSRLNALAQDAQGTLYTAGELTTESGSSYVLATISPLSGAATVVGEISVEGFQDHGIRSMAVSPDGTLYAISSRAGQIVDNRLITIDPQTAATTVIADLPHDIVYNLQGLDFAPNGTLYGWGANGDQAGLVTVDPTTGLVTDVDPDVGAYGTPIQTLVFLEDGSLMGYYDTIGGFDPENGFFYVGKLVQIDPTTGEPTLIATNDTPDIRGLADYPTLPDDPVISVEIDVKPGSNPDSINLASQGLIAVTIFTTDDFDAADVDVSTVVWAGANVAQKGNGSYFSALEDVDGDGDLDRVCHFRIEDTVLDQVYAQLLADDFDGDGILDSTRHEVELSLTGETTDGQLFEGSDQVDLFLSGKLLRDLLEESAAAGVI